MSRDKNRLFTLPCIRMAATSFVQHVLAAGDIPMRLALIRWAAAVCALAVASSQGLAQNMTGLGDFPGGYFRSDATGVSADGSVIIGWGLKHSFPPEACRWTKAGGMESLGHLPLAKFTSQPNAVSADGSVIVGQSESQFHGEAFRWTQDGGTENLGLMPGWILFSAATAVSADGSPRCTSVR